MPAQNENIELIQESLAGQGKAKEPLENNVDSQSFHLTPGNAGEVQRIQDAEIDDAKHRAIERDVALLAVSYWVEGPLASSATLWTIFKFEASVQKAFEVLHKSSFLFNKSQWGSI